MEETEKERRVKNAIGIHRFKAESPLADINQQVDNHINGIRSKTGNITELSAEAEVDIEKIKKESKRREYFHGKNIISKFFKHFLHSTGMSKELFIYQCAKEAKERNSVSTFFEELFTDISPHIK